MITWFGPNKKNTESLLSKEKDDFVSLSSHELRTPLSVIKWYTEMLLDEDAGPLTDEQRKYLTTIQSSNQKAIDLVRSLLNVSRLDLGTFCILPMTFSVSGLIDEVLCEFEKSVHKKNLTVIKKYGEAILEINSDKKICHVIFRALISNAISFSKDASDISLQIVGSGEERAVYDQKVPSNHILVAITNHGVGILENEKEKIFSKMFKGANSKDSDTGSGLGLYIAKTALESIGGKIWFDSEVSRTTFFVLLPKDGVQKKEGKTNLD